MSSASAAAATRSTDGFPPSEGFLPAGPGVIESFLCNKTMRVVSDVFAVKDRVIDIEGSSSSLALATEKQLIVYRPGEDPVSHPIAISARADGRAMSFCPLTDLLCVTDGNELMLIDKAASAKRISRRNFQFVTFAAARTPVGLTDDMGLYVYVPVDCYSYSWTEVKQAGFIDDVIALAAPLMLSGGFATDDTTSSTAGKKKRRNGDDGVLGTTVALAAPVQAPKIIGLDADVVGQRLFIGVRSAWFGSASATFNPNDDDFVQILNTHDINFFEPILAAKIFIRPELKAQGYHVALIEFVDNEETGGYLAIGFNKYRADGVEDDGTGDDLAWMDFYALNAPDLKEKIEFGVVSTHSGLTSADRLKFRQIPQIVQKVAAAVTSPRREKSTGGTDVITGESTGRTISSSSASPRRGGSVPSVASPGPAAPAVSGRRGRGQQQPTQEAVAPCPTVAAHHIDGVTSTGEGIHVDIDPRDLDSIGWVGADCRFVAFTTNEGDDANPVIAFRILRTSTEAVYSVSPIKVLLAMGLLIAFVWFLFEKLPGIDPIQLALVAAHHWWVPCLVFTALCMIYSWAYQNFSRPFVSNEFQSDKYGIVLHYAVVSAMALVLNSFVVEQATAANQEKLQYGFRVAVLLSTVKCFFFTCVFFFNTSNLPLHQKLHMGSLVLWCLTAIYDSYLRTPKLYLGPLPLTRVAAVGMTFFVIFQVLGSKAYNRRDKMLNIATMLFESFGIGLTIF